MKSAFVLLALLLAGPAAMARPADEQRQAEVAGRGGDVMPFSLSATQHVFTKTRQGGIQRVVARDPADTAQVRLVRRHLHQIQAQFRRGDFAGPAHIHGQDMPGLARLAAAKPGELAIEYRDVRGGAQLAYRSGSPALVSAVHAWFDAQLSDHGHDAMAGHEHGDGRMHGMHDMQGMHAR